MLSQLSLGMRRLMLSWYLNFLGYGGWSFTARTSALKSVMSKKWLPQPPFCHVVSNECSIESKQPTAESSYRSSSVICRVTPGATSIVRALGLICLGSASTTVAHAAARIVATFILTRDKEFHEMTQQSLEAEETNYYAIHRIYPLYSLSRSASEEPTSHHAPATMSSAICVCHPGWYQALRSTGTRPLHQ
jgi:hypothetical protein